MRLGVLSDIHGNLVALDAVLADMPPVDEIVCAGDVVGYNPWPVDCVERLRKRAVPTVQGNHDRAVAEGTAFRFNEMARAGVEYARDRLDAEDLDWLASLPQQRLAADRRVRLVHGHPDNPDHYTYPDEFMPELLDEEDVLVMGHTHVQAHKVYDEGIVMNPGSVGQPRDGDSRAAYAIVDLDAMEVEERRVTYDIDEVVRAIETECLPERIGTRLYEGR
ncbi:metallophosphoesterase family protein [Haloprofundus salilacus]|uniref:metallophosphoesterase family protein n=1 Tax=Haloprofundus salilacus TaxID=2876190 RepID=UPI001CCEA1B6|nr:YfcE family phosphodiesterase [Haloprofundus salilacus]